eukprot:scaffold770_cov255-Pinguiococcus_pyrenoidosus.AAC.33
MPRRSASFVLYLFSALGSSKTLIFLKTGERYWRAVSERGKSAEMVVSLAAAALQVCSGPPWS